MNIQSSILNDIAQRWRAEHSSAAANPPLRELLAEPGLEAAYQVQEMNTRHALAQGRRLVGRKIGLTSKSVQQQLGVDAPDFGMLFADMELAPGEEVPLGRVLQAKVEAEVAIVLKRGLDQPDLPFSLLLSAVDYVLPAVEIVGSRIQNWDISLLDTVADGASSGMYALGTEPRKLSQVDLRLCGMVMERRGELVSVGAGAACLGNPLNAALWLARKMVEVGRPLKEGDVIMSGALGPMVAAAPGDIIDTSIGGLGQVRTIFAR
jgi:2-keto-4-pentenoate hydratase